MLYHSCLTLLHLRSLWKELTVDLLKFLSLLDKKAEDDAEKVIAEMAAIVRMCQM